MKSLRGEFLSVSVVLAAVGAVVMSFPFDAIAFRPMSPSANGQSFAAFVSLDQEEEAAALKAAKSSWNAEAGGVRRLRAELFSSDLPKEKSEFALEFSDRIVRSVPESVAPGLSPFLPSLAAPPPKAIPVENADAAVDPAPVFSREELLKID